MPANIRASIGLFDGEVKDFIVPVGATVQILVDKGDFSLTEGEVITALSDGRDVILSATVKNGETYLITGNYKNG